MRSSHLLVAALPLAASLNLATPARPAASAGRCSNIRAIALDAPPDQLPSLSDAIPDCPRTVWDADELDIEYWQKKYKEEDLPLCPIEVIATPEANKQGVAYFIERRDELKAMLEKHGTIWFREFDLMKDEEGFRRMWEALDLDPCLDPLHSSGLRKFLAKTDAVYEEVNKQSLSKHYIGLHNESTNKKAAKAAAFVCFKPATVFGGEFFIADGERILRDLDPAVRTPTLTPSLTRTRTRTRTSTPTPTLTLTVTLTLTLTLSLTRCSRSCTRRRCASRRSTSTWTCSATCRAG